MTDNKELIARLRDRDAQELMSTEFWERVADAIEALQAKVVQLKIHAAADHATHHTLAKEIYAWKAEVELFHLYSPTDVKRAVLAAKASGASPQQAEPKEQT